MKKIFSCLTLLAFIGTAPAALNLVPNGNFETAGGASWVFAGGGATISYPATGGNGGGYAAMNSSGGWGVLVAQVNATTGLSLASLGLVAGSNYVFSLDMKNLGAGGALAGIKVEAWNAGSKISDSGDLKFNTTTSWTTYTTNWTIPATATSVMFVPLSVDGGNVGFDNVGVIIPSSPLTVSITSPATGAVVTANFTISANAAVSPGSVTNVSFYDGAALLGSDSNSPFSFDVSGAAQGSHSLKAIARDSGGNSATSSVVNITVTNWPAPVGWQLAWSDEFSQADGSSPDASKWSFDVGGSGWGNAQLEYDTARTNNARIVGGQLVIEAKQETYTGADSVTRNYTAARMLTKGKLSWTYGRIEASIKIPKGQGIWPAFWMLGANIDSVSWPTCGEIDIMENIGNAADQGITHGTLHGPGYSGGGGLTATYTLPGGAKLSDAFHVFAIEWSTNQIKWYLDNVQYFTLTPANLPGGATWVFNAPQFILLNLAVGGQWPGNPDGTTVFPQQMLVEYVRVYTNVPSVPLTPTGLTPSAGSAKVYLNWDASTSGATGYVIKRATTSGGTYAAVGSSANNNFTDTNVANCSNYYYVVTATNSIGSSSNSTEAGAILGAFALAVNSGGSAAGQFVADAFVTGGTVGATVATTIDTSGLTAPAPQAVYQAERYGNFTYTFTGLIAGATYNVRLHSAETYWTAVGQRRFNVLINGAQVLTNFDIIAAAGAANKAVISEFNTIATNGQIVVQYTTVTDNARASGIEITLPQPTSPAGLTASASNSQVLLKWNALAGASYNVKRALVSGGAYSTVFSGLVTTNCTDSGLTNGVAYCYVVSASVLGCESTNSAFVSATPACSPPPAPTVGNNGPLFMGMTLNLTATTVPGATYSWTGPNGFNSTNQNPSIVNASTNASGLFRVTAAAGGCTSTQATTTVVVNPPASLTVQALAGSLILSWPGGTLQSVTNLSGSWSNVSGATSPRTNPPTAAQEFYRLKLQ